MRLKNQVSMSKKKGYNNQIKPNETSILFNNSRIELYDNVLNIDMKESEVLFLASCSFMNEKDVKGLWPLENININWVKCFESCEDEVELQGDETELLIVTRDIFWTLSERGYSKEDIYRYIKENGVYRLVKNLLGVENFSILIVQIVGE